MGTADLGGRNALRNDVSEQFVSFRAENIKTIQTPVLEQRKKIPVLIVDHSRQGHRTWTTWSAVWVPKDDIRHDWRGGRHVVVNLNHEESIQTHSGIVLHRHAVVTINWVVCGPEIRASLSGWRIR